MRHPPRLGQTGDLAISISVDLRLAIENPSPPSAASSSGAVASGLGLIGSAAAQRGSGAASRQRRAGRAVEESGRAAQLRQVQRPFRAVSSPDAPQLPKSGRDTRSARFAKEDPRRLLSLAPAPASEQHRSARAASEPSRAMPNIPSATTPSATRPTEIPFPAARHAITHLPRREAVPPSIPVLRRSEAARRSDTRPSARTLVVERAVAAPHRPGRPSFGGVAPVGLQVGLRPALAPLRLAENARSTLPTMVAPSLVHVPARGGAMPGGAAARPLEEVAPAPTSPLPGRPSPRVASPAPPPARLGAPELRAVADRVYDTLVERLRQERRARGL